MLTRSCSLVSTFIVMQVLAGTAVRAQEIQVLLLPEDQAIIDELTRAGTIESPGLMGLSRMVLPDTNTTYYIIDQVAAARGRISEGLADVWRNDSDISIAFDLLGGEFVHLRLAEEAAAEIRYFRFEDWLGVQLSEKFESGGNVDNASVEFLEYRIPITNCPEISEPISRMAIAFEEAASSIGTRSAAEELEEIVVDGPYYQLTTRMNRLLEVRFGVGANAGPLFDAVHSIMLTVRECREGLTPKLRTMSDRGHR